MKYAVDEIIDDIAVLENIETGESIEVSCELLPGDIEDGTILSFVDGKYKCDLDEEMIRRKRILEKMSRLKNLKRSDTGE